MATLLSRRAFLTLAGLAGGAVVLLTRPADAHHKPGHGHGPTTTTTTTTTTWPVEDTTTTTLPVPVDAYSDVYADIYEVA